METLPKPIALNNNAGPAAQVTAAAVPPATPKPTASVHGSGSTASAAEAEIERRLSAVRIRHDSHHAPLDDELPAQNRSARASTATPPVTTFATDPFLAMTMDLSPIAAGPRATGIGSPPPQWPVPAVATPSARLSRASLHSQSRPPKSSPWQQMPATPMMPPPPPPPRPPLRVSGSVRASGGGVSRFSVPHTPAAFPPPPQQQPRSTPLTQLLSLCTVSAPMTFASVFESQGWVFDNDTDDVVKIAEASYSDVFTVASGSVVLKVMPFQVDDPVVDNSWGKSTRNSMSSVQSTPATPRAERWRRQHRNDGGTTPLSPPRPPPPTTAAVTDQSQLRTARDLLPDIAIAHAVAHIPGFVCTRAAWIVRDAYPTALVRAAHAFAEEFPDDALNPLPVPQNDHQWFCIVAMPPLGDPLDRARIRGARDARSVLAQVTRAVATAERECAFEHRDLHWGNVLVQRHQGKGAAPLVCTVIDFTLSRANVVANGAGDGGSTGACWSVPDPDVFAGDPDLDEQFGVYPAMRRVVGAEGVTDLGEVERAWSGYFPRTNVLWIKYLASKVRGRAGARRPTP
ncbi:hypothetical protein BC828DRAFT_418090 [Blastocladiella britannica]|nr:hypothetical protein BC828DRAFT_418090 [Blastocladiella britannica]